VDLKGEHERAVGILGASKWKGVKSGSLSKEQLRLQQKWQAGIVEFPWMISRGDDSGCRATLLREQLALSTLPFSMRIFISAPWPSGSMLPPACPSLSFFVFGHLPFHSCLNKLHYLIHHFKSIWFSLIMHYGLLDSILPTKTTLATGDALCCPLRQRRLHQLRDPIP
jgi:hypothetical protein